MDVVDGGWGAVEGTRSSVMHKGSSSPAKSSMVLPAEKRESFAIGNVVQSR